MVAPHSEQAGTCERTSFQCKVIHIPQGDSYMTVVPHGGPGGYLQGRFACDYECLGWACALSFSDCISLITITILESNYATRLLPCACCLLSHLGRLEARMVDMLYAVDVEGLLHAKREASPVSAPIQRWPRAPSPKQKIQYVTDSRGFRSEMAPRTRMPAVGCAPAGRAGALGTRDVPGTTLRRHRGP